MKLEKQLAKLAELGLALDPGITIDDLLHSFDREEFEEEPFDLVLFALGIEVEREPWGRAVCSRAWNFDTECIHQTGDYVRIVKRLCRVAGEPDLLREVSDSVDLEKKDARLQYKVGDLERNWKVAVNNDWIDPETIAKIMGDIERDGRRKPARAGRSRAARD